MSAPRLPESEVAKLHPAGWPGLRAVRHGTPAAEAVRLPGSSPFSNLVLAGFVPDAQDLGLLVRAWSSWSRVHLDQHEHHLPDDCNCTENMDLYDWLRAYISWEQDRYFAAVQRVTKESR